MSDINVDTSPNSNTSSEVEKDCKAINEICDVYSMEDALKIFRKRIKAHQKNYIHKSKLKDLLHQSEIKGRIAENDRWLGIADIKSISHEPGQYVGILDLHARIEELNQMKGKDV